MSEETDELHPRITTAWFGHAEAERALLQAYQTGRIAHAWLIGGPPGIGKATLAYRMARFVLANPDPTAAAVQAARDLSVPADHPSSRRIAGEAHGDLLALERVLNDKGKLNTTIRIEQVRRTVGFFGSTSSEGGWRIAIVDAVDDLQKEGENALLKILEEPPPRSLLLLISHAPGRVLPTIRSRTRRLLLRPLDTDTVAQAVANATGRAANDIELSAAAQASGGSVARALDLLDSDALALRQTVVDLLARLPSTDPRALHALGDALGGSEPKTLAVFLDLVNQWLADRLTQDKADSGKAARTADAFATINQAAREADAYNLERKPLVFKVFGLLAETARG
ncbi:MAG: DNA polymerase III subunit delta' [Pseudolabrys sp.]|nr:DNA polymerase III subunit delta' [Pseudolabrys sp.]